LRKATISLFQSHNSHPKNKKPHLAQNCRVPPERGQAGDIIPFVGLASSSLRPRISGDVKGTSFPYFASLDW
jgi:hypothetical protein